MIQETAGRWARVITFAGMALAVLALALAATAALHGERVRWTIFALPLVLLVNGALLVSGFSRARPRLAVGMAFVTLIAALIILLAETHVADGGGVSARVWRVSLCASRGGDGGND